MNRFKHRSESLTPSSPQGQVFRGKELYFEGYYEDLNSQDLSMCFFISWRASFLYRLTGTSCMKWGLRTRSGHRSVETYSAFKAETWGLLTCVVQLKYHPDDFRRLPTFCKYVSLLSHVVSGLLLFKSRVSLACLLLRLFSHFSLRKASKWYTENTTNLPDPHSRPELKWEQNGIAGDLCSPSMVKSPPLWYKYHLFNFRP